MTDPAEGPGPREPQSTTSSARTTDPPGAAPTIAAGASGVLGELLAQLARWDEDAFVALANRGLLRRAQKDLEKISVVVGAEDRGAVAVGVGEHQVRLDRRGPAHAVCSCPASGVCQHILLAALALQRGVVVAEVGQEETAAGAPEVGRLHQELMAISHQSLLRHAGKPGYRWAWQVIQDLDPEDGMAIGGERHLVIALRHPTVTLRYLGGGLPGLIAEPTPPRLERLQVAAVLAYQRAHGASSPPPEEAGRGGNEVLDLGAEHRLRERAPEVRRRSREELRRRVRELETDCLALGLSHLSPAVHERWNGLAVWAQGAEYHRLALLLRRVADHVEMAIARAGGADEHRLFDELAVVHALVTALEVASARGEEPIRLVGRPRSRYDELARLELVGLGALAWRSAAGWLGLTMVFWAPGEQTFLTATDARPELQRFDPVARYRAAGPWGGLGAPAQASGRRLTLAAAQVNAAGRLSLAASTAAVVDAAPLRLAGLPVVRRWGELRATRALARRSMLAEPTPAADWTVLEPATWGPPWFDAARQTLVWPLGDDAGDALPAELPFDDFIAAAIARIEQLGVGELPVGTRLVARLRGGAARLVVEPLSLLRPGPDDTTLVDVLAFDPAPQPGFMSRWLGRLAGAGEGRVGHRVAGADGGAATLLPASLPAALRSLRQWLERQAERGLAPADESTLRAELAPLLARLVEAGLGVPAGVGELPLVEWALRARYWCLQLEQLIAGGDAPEE